MRIGIDTHAAEGPPGGNATYVRSLVLALAGLDDPTDEYVLYALDPAHPFYAELAHRPRVSVRRVWPRGPLLRIPLALAAGTVRDRLDVLHVQYVGPPWHRGARVVTIHDLGFLHVPDSFPFAQRQRLRWQVRGNARRASVVITGSRHVRDDMERTYGLPADRIVCIPYAPDPRFVPVTDAERLATLQERLGIRHPYVLSVGRANPRKNLLAVVRAFERVRPRLRAPTALVIAGPDDHGSAALRAAIAASPCRGDIVVAGRVASEDLPALFSGAAVFVYPSSYEGFGLPPIEAMACGTPVVSSAAGALGEVLGEAALLVEPDDVDALGAALQRVLEETALRADLARRGRIQAGRLDWETTARRTRDAYQRAVRHRAVR